MKNAFKPEWCSKEERTVALPEASRIAFQVYANRLYTGCVSIDTKGGGVEKDKSSLSELEWTKWTQCYELGRFLQDIDECSNHLVNLIYSTTSQSSPYRKLIVDLGLKTWPSTANEDLKTVECTAEFFAGLGAEFLVTARSERLGIYDFLHTRYKQNACLYHEHTISKAPCYKVSRDLS